MSDVFFAYFASVSELWLHSCYLHTQVSGHVFDLIIYNICYNVDQNSDLSASMCVRRYKSFRFSYFFKSSDVHVLADNSNLSCQCFLNSLSCVWQPFFSHECFHVCCVRSHSLSCNFANICLELLILGNEVCLCVNFYNNCSLVIIRYHNLADTFCCDSACFLLSSSQSFFSQELNCLVHIAFCSCKSLLTIHHTSAGHLS